MDEALEAAEFLARSENRVAALFALHEGPLSRSELRDATETSQVTIGRVLGDLEDRRWIEADGSDYRITAVGEMVADALKGFLDALAAAETLGDIARWLPTDAYDFDLERLAHAVVARPDPSDPNATMRTAAQQVGTSDHVRILTHGYSSLVMDVVHDRVLAGEMTVEFVFSPDVFEAMSAAPRVHEKLATLVESEGTSFFRYDGEVPHIMAILDDGVGIGVDDDEGLPRATLGVRDPVVRNWAIETFERYRADAVAVDDPDEILPPDRAR